MKSLNLISFIQVIDDKRTPIGEKLQVIVFTFMLTF